MSLSDFSSVAVEKSYRCAKLIGGKIYFTGVIHCIGVGYGYVSLAISK